MKLKHSSAQQGKMATQRRAESALIVALLLAACAGPTVGQTSLTVGPRLGVTISAMQFDDAATEGQTEVLAGPQVGVAARAELSRIVSAEVDLLLSREGYRGSGAHTGDLQMDYVSVPLLLRIRTPTRFSAHLMLGGAAKLGVRCRQTGVPLVGATGCGDPVMGSDWNRLDIAAIFGGGLSVPWGKRTLSADVAISRGLRDLNGGLYVPGTVHSLSASLTFAALFPLGGGSAEQGP